MGFFDLFKSKTTSVEPLKNDISDFFKIDICDIFKYNPVFEGTELNSAGSRIDKYSLRFKELEMNMFFEVEIIKFQSGEYNLNFKGNTNIISEEAKEFIKFVFQQFGYDDNGKGNITSSDYQDAQNEMFDRWWHHNGIWMTNVAERNISLSLSETITCPKCGTRFKMEE